MIQKIKNMLLSGLLLLLVFGIWLAFGKNIKESQGFKVAVVAGTPFETKAHLFKNISGIRLEDDDSRTFKQLVRDEVDVVIANRLTGLNLIKKAGYRNLRLAGELLDRETATIAFQPEDKALRQTVNRALVSIIRDGTYAWISFKYFGRDILKGLKRGLTYPDEPVASDDSWRKIQQKGQVRFAMSNGYQPFIYFDENKQLTGFNIEIAQAVCNNLGVEFIPVITTWEEIGEGLRAKHYDSVLGITTISSKWLNNEAEFSDPFYYSGAQLFVCDDSPITGSESLQKEEFPGLFLLPKIIPKLPNIFKH